MKAVLRPGPYICAEWDFGGFPHWFASSKVGPGLCNLAAWLSAYPASSASDEQAQWVCWWRFQPADMYHSTRTPPVPAPAGGWRPHDEDEDQRPGLPRPRRPLVGGAVCQAAPAAARKRRAHRHGAGGPQFGRVCWVGMHRDRLF